MNSMTYVMPQSKFFSENYRELMKIMHTRLGSSWYAIDDQLHELLAEFYVHCDKFKTLEKFDPSRGRIEVFIFSAISYWLSTRRMRYEKRKELIKATELNDSVAHSTTDYDIRLQYNEMAVEAKYVSPLLPDIIHYILLGYNVKQSAEIMGISYHTARWALYRLRKIINRSDYF